MKFLHLKLTFLFWCLVFLMGNSKLNAQQNLCTFSQSPNTAIYNCGTSLIATFQKQNLPLVYNQLELYYPLQFDLVQLGNTIINENSYQFGSSLYDAITINDPSQLGNPSISVTLKRVRIPLNTLAINANTFTCKFSVNTCESANFPNLYDISQYPMYFDATAWNNNFSQSIPFYFPQQVQQFGSSGLLKFTNLQQSSAVLSTNEPWPNLSNPLANINRYFTLELRGDQFTSVDITIILEQDVELTFFRVFDPTNINTSNWPPANPPNTGSNLTPQSVGSNTYTLTRAFLESQNYVFSSSTPTTIYFYHRSKYQCPIPANTLLTTSIQARVNCPQSSCTPIVSNTIQWNATYPLNRPYNITGHTVLSNNTGCFDNLQYKISYNFPASTSSLGIRYLEFPFVAQDLNVTSVSVGATGVSALTLPNPNNNVWSISNNNILKIDLGYLPTNFLFPGLTYEDFIGFTTPSGEINFDIYVNFSYDCDEFSACDNSIIDAISPNFNNFSTIKFKPKCEDTSPLTLVNSPLPSVIQIPNQNYQLSGGCTIVDLDQAQNPNLLLNFNYQFLTSGNLSPMGVYNFPGNTILAGCGANEMSYELLFTNTLSGIQGANLFTFIENNPPGQISAFVNGSPMAILGTITGNSLLFTIPANLITTQNTIQFTLDLSTCPFSNMPQLANNGVTIFNASLRVVCSSCPTCVRTLACIGGHQTAGNYLVMHCVGPCDLPLGGAGTYDFTAERASFGSPATNVSAEPIANKQVLASLIGNSELLESELSKVYPYDLIEVHAPGHYTHSSNVNTIQFEIAHDPLLNASGNSFLELVPSSAFVRFTFLGTDNLPLTTPAPINFPFSDNVVFLANGTLIYGLPPNQVTLNVNELTLNLSNLNFASQLNQIGSIAWPSQRASLDFYAVFKVIPAQTFVTNPYVATNTSMENILRGQFLTQYTGAPQAQTSCDSWGDKINLLIPGAITHQQTEDLSNAVVDLPLDETNISVETFNFSGTTPASRSRCKQNLAYGVHLFGGKGPTHRDFDFEFRPFIRWPQNASLSINGTSPNNFTVFNLYNQPQAGLPINANSSNFALSLPLYMKAYGTNPNNYAGLAFSIDKDGPTALDCAINQNQQSNISLNLPLVSFSYLNNILGSTIYTGPNSLPNPPYQTTEITTITNNTNLIQNPQSLPVANNIYGGATNIIPVTNINTYDLCERLSGMPNNATPAVANVSDNFSYTFNFGTTTGTPPADKRVWALCRFVDASGIPLNSITNWGVSSTLLTSLGATQFASSDNAQKLIYFANEPTTQQQITITSNAGTTICLPQGAQLEIRYGMFCTDITANLTDFFENQDAVACFTCAKQIPLIQEKGVEYSSSSSIAMNNETCVLTWDIQLQNKPNNVSLTNNSLRLVVPEGLLFSSISPSNLTFQLTAATSNVAGVTNVSTVLDINLADNLWQSGEFIGLQVNFVFSNDLCQNMYLKGQTELRMYVFGSAQCGNSGISNIPITGGGEFPVTFESVEGLIETLQAPQSACCKDIQINYSTLGSCPTINNGALNLAGVTLILPSGNVNLLPYTIATLSTINDVGIQSPLPAYTAVNISTLNNVVLGPGNYFLLLQISGSPDLPTLTVYRYITIEADAGSCVCDCQYLTGLTPLLVDPSITTSTQLANNNPSLNLNGRCIQLQNNFTIDNFTSLNNCEIKVPAGRKIDILQGAGNVLLATSCIFSGCEKLWKGIENSGQLNLTSTTIRDAFFGVYIKAGGAQSFPNSTFRNNFVGLVNDPSAGLTSFNLNGSVTFNGGALLPSYSGCFPVPTSYSFAGAVLRKISTVQIGGGLFQNLHNGIIAQQTMNITFNSTRFSNIGTQDIVNQGLYSGSDYWLTGSNSTDQNSLLTPPRSAIATFDCDAVSYLGSGSIQAHFNNVYNCITSVSDRNLTVTRASMQQVIRAGITHFSNYSNLTIDNNRILLRYGSTSTGGIMIFNPTSNVYGNIQNNRITGLNPAQGQWNIPNYRRGIYVSGNSGATALNITSNNIKNMRYSIWGQNCKGLGIYSNPVTLRSFGGLAYGVLIENSLSTKAYCNTIASDELQQYVQNSHYGIYLKLSPQSSVIDNQISECKYGIFAKDNNSFSSVKLNNLNNHKFGIYIDINSRIGHQNFSQNTYNGAFEKQAADVSLGDWQINYDPTFPTPSPYFSSFRYGLNQTGTEAWLTYPDFPSNLCSQNYFYRCFPQYLGQLTSPCDNPEAKYAQIDKDFEELNDSILFDKTAKNELVFSEFDLEYTAKVKRYLAPKIENMRTKFPDEGEYALLYETLETGAEAKFYRTDKALIGENFDSTFIRSLDDASAVIDEKLQLLHLTDSLKQAGLLNDADFAQQFENYLNELKAQQDLQQLKMDLLKNVNAIPNAKLKNQSVDALYLHEEFEKQVNELFLEKIADKRLSINSDELNQLLQIAGTCPKIGGAAVFKARGLLAMFSDTLFVDDELLCAQQGLQYRKGQHIQLKTLPLMKAIELFPNPTNQSLTIKIEAEITEPFSVIITNALGQIVWRGETSKRETILNSEIINLSPGAYFIRLNNSSKKIDYIEKLIKL